MHKSAVQLFIILQRSDLFGFEGNDPVSSNSFIIYLFYLLGTTY